MTRRRQRGTFQGKERLTPRRDAEVAGTSPSQDDAPFLEAVGTGSSSELPADQASVADGDHAVVEIETQLTDGAEYRYSEIAESEEIGAAEPAAGEIGVFPVRELDEEQGEVEVEPRSVAVPNGHERTADSTDAVTTPAEALPPQATGLSVEGALWILIAILAAGLRFGDLGRWPLSEREASLALAAWQASQGLHYLTNGFSPLLLNATDLLFLLFSATDSWARAASALAGLATISSLWLLRPLLGRGTVLGATVLMALSPSLLFFSRQAQPEALSLLFSLLVVAGITRYAESRRTRDAWLAGVALALGLASGPGFWSVLVAGAIFSAWRWRSNRAPRSGELPAEPETTLISNPQSPISTLRPLLPRLAVAGLAIFAAAATALGANPAGLGAAFDAPAQWIGAIMGEGSSMGLPFMLTVLLYELPIVILGIAGAAILIEEQPRWVGFLLVWAAVTLVPATVFNSNWAGGVAITALPLALLGGGALARIASRVQQYGRVETEGIYLALVGIIGGFLWLNLLRYLQDPRSLHLWLALAALLVLIAGLAMVWSMGGTGGLWRALGLTGAVLLPLVALRTAWMLAFVHGSDPREPLVAAQIPTHADLRNLALFLSDISNERLRERDTLPVSLQESLGAAPHWYLRDFRNLTLVASGAPSLPAAAASIPGAASAAVLGPDEEAPPGTIGSRYVIRPTWERPLLGRQPTIRWIITRDVQTGMGGQEAILYVQVPGTQ
ncbi:MAG TPA: glycosyltransferase family 39 protein [Ardenticatenaceae bacterium]|nr:glycosyltransferase family 39 protein [Ardenticatenaceae bacterium]